MLRRAIVRWCRANGEQLEDVFVLMADRYLELHSINGPSGPRHGAGRGASARAAGRI
ncbi:MULTISPECIES: hypothetical protein [Kitasatospora]|uniref:Uncharacterized protein n=1 Tax=Kitasatospora cystarginea TaxID=58350 RepID=A0ABP5S1C2_9ACTN